MHVGMMMVFASYGWENCPDARVWDEEIRLARLAADLGFDCLWSAEHHFNDYSFVPDNLQLWTGSAMGRSAKGSATQSALRRVGAGYELLHRPLGMGARMVGEGLVLLGDVGLERRQCRVPGVPHCLGTHGMTPRT